MTVLALPLIIGTASANPSGGGGGGGGALSGVSSGLGGASRGGSSSGGGGGGSSGGSSHPPSSPPRDDGYRASIDERITEICYDGTGRATDAHGIDDCRRPIVHHDGNAVVVKRRVRAEPPASTAQLAVYAGAQKVHDSDGSASVELAVTDWRLRFSAGFSRYYERLPNEHLLTMTMPTMTGGIRIDDMGKTAVYLEAGVVLVRTNGDVMGDTKLTGPVAGMRVEHPLNGDIKLLGDVQQMWFDHDIKATSGKVSVRYKFVQAGFRVLDFNVGPALYGPEVGVSF